MAIFLFLAQFEAMIEEIIFFMFLTTKKKVKLGILYIIIGKGICSVIRGGMICLNRFLPHMVYFFVKICPS